MTALPAIVVTAAAPKVTFVAVAPSMVITPKGQ